MLSGGSPGGGSALFQRSFSKCGRQAVQGWFHLQPGQKRKENAVSLGSANDLVLPGNIFALSFLHCWNRLAKSAKKNLGFCSDLYTKLHYNALKVSIYFEMPQNHLGESLKFCKH